ncbi:hypothetical protein [Rhodosalinus sp. FB01]|uniref:hypothetical protein n=1 Tax=Rhodosalinus sp. FB01 TaxID=3239194 RepID=UPI003525B29F
MADKGSRRGTRTNTTTHTLEEYIGRPALLPGESEELFNAMAGAIRRQLDPRNILQQLACDDVVNLRWEILRHRRLRQKSVEAWFARDVAQLYEGIDLKVPTGSKLETEDNIVRLAFGAVSGDPDRREAAEEYFDHKTGFDRDIILADSYAAAPSVKCHDAKLNMLMRQHRQAMRDYEEMKAADARCDIPDAEIVEDVT